MNNLKSFLKALVPPILFFLLKKMIPNKYGWKGKFKSWNEAIKFTTGYNNKKIIDKVRASMHKVKLGQACYERDGVLFYNKDYNWPLLTTLLFSYLKNNYLSILDFGGSLGSTYFQNKKYLSELENFKWSVVEQPIFTKVGKLEFEDKNLFFFSCVENCIKSYNPNVLILSSVLQYIEEPYQLLKKLLSFNFETIIIDRTPFVKERDYLTIQHVPPNIYKANYPCWFFNKNFFLNFFLDSGYFLEYEFDAVDGKTKKYEFKGLIFSKEIKVE